MLLDLGPLLLFFFANSRPEFFAPVLSRFLPANMITGEHAGIFVATAVFIPAILAALVIAYVLTRHIAVMPVVTAVIVVVFGGLTLALQNETFIKLKPTLVYLLFAVTLLGGLAFKKPLLGMVFDSVFNLTDEGWRKLTLRWGVFFLLMAVLNEIVWRNFIDRRVGQLQGVRLPAADDGLRGGAVSAAAEVRGAGDRRRDK